MNKYIILTIVIFTSTFASAQVAIGKQSVDGTSTILEFFDGTSNLKGIILPALNNDPVLTSSNNGTFYYNATDRKVKMFEGVLKPLSESGVLPSYYIENTSDEIIPVDQKQGVIIGDNMSSAEGVLVLESANKALILPKIESPESKVVHPYPGMMCYDTTSKSLAVFDGSNWNYWKAKP